MGRENVSEGKQHEEKLLFVSGGEGGGRVGGTHIRGRGGGEREYRRWCLGGVLFGVAWDGFTGRCSIRKTTSFLWVFG